MKKRIDKNNLSFLLEKGFARAIQLREQVAVELGETDLEKVSGGAVPSSSTNAIAGGKTIVVYPAGMFPREDKTQSCK